MSVKPKSSESRISTSEVSKPTASVAKKEMFTDHTKHTIFKTILVLSVLGLFVSLYLAQAHFAGVEAGSSCDFSETINCSLVNSSEYAKLFGVPVAIFGVLWTFILGLLAYAGLKNDQPAITGLLIWTGSGMLFVFYLIYAEFQIGAICPYCTVVHLITLIAFILSIILFRSTKQATEKEQLLLFRWLIGAAVLFIIPLIAVNFFGPNEDYTEFAQCLTENDVVMYGSFRCGVCAKTRQLFGDAFEYVNEIECHPQGKNPQTELCVQKGIEKTPTWIIEREGVEISRSSGWTGPEQLSQMSGCPLSLIKEAN